MEVDIYNVGREMSRAMSITNALIIVLRSEFVVQIRILTVVYCFGHEPGCKQ